LLRLSIAFVLISAVLQFDRNYARGTPQKVDS
jgi:hypothetical protein